jgi:putative RecB family exonuclease
VIDYKTHAEMWQQSRVDTDLQLTLYSLGCKNALDIEPTRFSYFFLAHNQVISTQRTEIHEKQALEELETIAQKIEKEEFPPDTTQCVRCDFKNSCKYSVVK